MKKKSYIGTLNTGYFAGDICRSIEIKSRTMDCYSVILHVLNGLGIELISARHYQTKEFGLVTFHDDINCIIPADKMQDFLKAAKNAGLKIGV